MRTLRRRKRLGIAVPVLGLVLAILCFVSADGDGALLFLGVVVAVSALLGLATFFVKRKPRSPSRETDETAR